MKISEINSLPQRVISNLFYLTFTSVILSPFLPGAEYITGISLYLFLFVPLLDINFLFNHLAKSNKTTSQAVMLILLATILLTREWFLVLKLVNAIIVVAYIGYTHKTGKFYLHRYMLLNIVVAIIQFAGFTIFGQKLLEPSMLAGKLYGRYASIVGDTFSLADSYIAPVRVSGLSREPGFFSSMLIISFLVLLADKKAKFKGFYIGAYIVGMALSFSKITAAFLVGGLCIFLLRKVIQRIPLLLLILGFVAVIAIGVRIFYDKTQIHWQPGGSISSRTIGYYLLTDMKLSEYAFGTGLGGIINFPEYTYLQNILFYDIPDHILINSGLAKIIIEEGLLYFILLVLLIGTLHPDKAKLMLFLVCTVNVNPFTTSSFVLLGIFYFLYHGWDENDRGESIKLVRSSDELISKHPKGR